MGKLYLVISIAIITAILLLTACGQNSVEQENDLGESPVVTSEDINSIGEDAYLEEDIYESPYHSNDNAKVFDFSELLAAYDYPNGIMTVNQLTERFGTPKKIIGWNLPIHKLLRIDVVFNNMQVEFAAVPTDYFSFDEEASEDGSCVTLTESDKDLNLSVTGIQVFGNEKKLPRGLEIGVSTKEQIIKAYGEEPYLKTKPDRYDFVTLSYRYAFFKEPEEILKENTILDIGEITYFFDGNEDILSKVIISWISGD